MVTENWMFLPVLFYVLVLSVAQNTEQGFWPRLHVRDWNVMASSLNVVRKDILPIMAELYKEAVTTEAHPSLNRPPDWNIGLWVKTPKETWNTIKVMLLASYLRSGEK